MGSRLASRVCLGLRTLWRRPSWVRIPPPAPIKGLAYRQLVRFAIATNTLDSASRSLVGCPSQNSLLVEGCSNCNRGCGRDNNSHQCCRGISKNHSNLVSTDAGPERRRYYSPIETVHQFECDFSRRVLVYSLSY